MLERGEARLERRALLERDEDAVAQLAVERLRQVALAVGIFDEQDFAGADAPRLAVARRDLYARVEVDDVLAPRRRMPVEIVVGLDLAEDDAGRGHPLREPAGPGRLGILDLDVLEVRLAVLVRIEPMDLHESPPRVRGLGCGDDSDATARWQARPERLYSRKWPRNRRSVSSRWPGVGARRSRWRNGSSARGSPGSTAQARATVWRSARRWLSRRARSRSVPASRTSTRAMRSTTPRRPPGSTSCRAAGSGSGWV